MSVPLTSIGAALPKTVVWTVAGFSLCSALVPLSARPPTPRPTATRSVTELTAGRCSHWADNAAEISCPPPSRRTPDMCSPTPAPQPPAGPAAVSSVTLGRVDRAALTPPPSSAPTGPGLERRVTASGCVTRANIGDFIWLSRRCDSHQTVDFADILRISSKGDCN